MKLKNCNTLTKIIIGVGCLSSTLGLMVTPVRSQQYGPATCRQGYVWREAVARDRVCVTPSSRAQAKYDNSQAAFRINPNGGNYGTATCRQGYVWREAVAKDIVCVTPKIRTQTAYENSQAVYRRVGSVPIDNGTNLIPASN